MPFSYEIRRARKAELALLPGIEAAADRLFPEGRIPQPGDVVPLSELEKAHEEELVLVAASAEQVVGFAMARVHGSLLHLYAMAVHPDHGRSGIGTRLLTRIIQEAVRRRLSGVTLTTFADLPWNAPFYEKLGFHTLDPPSLSPMLRAILAREESVGMRNRVALLFSNDP